MISRIEISQKEARTQRYTDTGVLQIMLIYKTTGYTSAIFHCCTH